MSHLSSASLSVPRSVVDHSKPGLPDVPVWLDEIEGDRALSWVKKQNFATCTAYEGTERFERLRSRLETVCDSPGRVPTVSEVVGGLYNVWTDDEHSHGLWRRTTWDSYRASAPVTDSAACDDVTEWEILLDVDALREEEECAWVWRGASLLRTGPMAGRRALVDLSVNGSDADVTREYDIDEQRFVDVTEGGFSRSLAKGSLLWADDVGERVLALTDWGPGSLTASGYPRQVRRLSRGEYAGGINPASGPGEMLLVAPTDAVAAWAHRDRWGRTWLMVRLDFYNEELWLLPDGAETLPVSAAAVAGDGFFIAPGAIHIDVPVSAKVSAVRGHLLIQLREDWAVGTMTYPAGALLATPLEDFLSGSPEMTILFSPTPERSLQGWVTTAHHVVLHLLDDVVDAFEVATDPTDNTDNNEWRVRPLDLAPLATAIGSAITLTTPDSADAATLLRPGRPLLSVSLRSVSAVEDDRLWITVSSFTVPTTLAVASLGADGALDFVEVLRRAPELFDASDIVVSQHAAISADGTRVPYFQIGRSTSSDEYARTMLYGYGGFEVPVGIGYLSTTGSAWLEEGGTYVIANVRGGGEYGPAWHQAGLKENRHHVHERLLHHEPVLRPRSRNRPRRGIPHGLGTPHPLRLGLPMAGARVLPPRTILHRQRPPASMAQPLAPQLPRGRQRTVGHHTVLPVSEKRRTTLPRAQSTAAVRLYRHLRHVSDPNAQRHSALRFVQPNRLVLGHCGLPHALDGGVHHPHDPRPDHVCAVEFCDRPRLPGHPR